MTHLNVNDPCKRSLQLTSIKFFAHESNIFWMIYKRQQRRRNIILRIEKSPFIQIYQFKLQSNKLADAST